MQGNKDILVGRLTASNEEKAAQNESEAVKVEAPHQIQVKTEEGSADENTNAQMQSSAQVSCPHWYVAHF